MILFRQILVEAFDSTESVSDFNFALPTLKENLKKKASEDVEMKLNRDEEDSQR